MDPTISPSCATWLSMSCERTTPSLPCVESSSSQAGMTNTWPSLSLNFEMRLPCRRSAVDECDHRQRWLLRTQRERPSRRRATEQGDELAPPHGFPLWAEDRTLSHRCVDRCVVHHSKTGRRRPLGVNRVIFDTG